MIITEGFSDWHEGLDADEWSTLDWDFLVDNTSSLGETTVDVTGDVTWAGDFGLENWLLESWGGEKLAGVEDSSGGWDDLPGASVDRVSVESGIVDVETHSSHGLVAEHSGGGDDLETGDAGVLNFVHELTGSGGVNEEIWTISFRLDCQKTLNSDLLRSTRSC